MTARQIFESMLIELSKVNAPSLLLSDFNYYINKAINQYINKRYNIYDVNLQTTDDIRVLKATTILEPYESYKGVYKDLKDLGAGNASLFGATYEIAMPSDYLHPLNCICIYKVQKRFKCYNAGDDVQFAAKRLTADTWSVIMNDFYNRPLPWRPYYYVHNVNTSTTNPTNPTINNTFLNTSSSKDVGANNGTDIRIKYPNDTNSGAEVSNNNSNLPRTINLTNGIGEVDMVEREAGVRYGNESTVRIEIRYGHDSSVFKLTHVLVDYIKVPQEIRLTQELVDLTSDTSQIMEFPDYVCQEIINELTTLVMENTADPRLQTHPVVTQSIANPAQALAQPQARAARQAAAAD